MGLLVPLVCIFFVLHPSANDNVGGVFVHVIKPTQQMLCLVEPYVTYGCVICCDVKSSPPDLTSHTAPLPFVEVHTLALSVLPAYCHCCLAT
jgi:hypothetical protein